MIIQDIFPPEKIKKITKEKILGIRHYKNKKDKYFNISWRVLVAVIIFAAVFSLTGFPSKVFGEIGFFEEKIKLDITEIKLQSKYQQANIIKRNYKLQKASFIKEAKDKNSIQIEVGDKAKDKFTPEMTIRKWDDEVNLKVKYRHNIKEKNQTVDLEGDKIKWENHKTEVHYYEVKEGDVIVGDTTATADGYEVEVILLEKPDVNVVEFDIETKGLKYYYQPALTEELQNGYSEEFQKEIVVSETEVKDLEGNVLAHRPENVIGSYAVYHESKQGDYSKMGLKNYRAGKAFHIFRPRIIDNAGKEVWGKLNIDVENKLLTVEIPQEFLDNAVYPIRIDPEFGYHTIGGSSLSTYNKIIGGNYAGSAGTVSMISFYGRRSYADSRSKAALYKKSDYSLQSPQSSHISVPVDNAWNDHTLTPSITAIDYIIAIWLGYWDSHIYYDTDAGWGKEYYKSYSSNDNSDPANWNAWPDPLTEGSAGNGYGGDRKFSIYCTYTAGATYQPRSPGVSPSGGGMMIF